MVSEILTDPLNSQLPRSKFNGELLIGCSGWNYGDTPDKGGWTEVFYPDK